MSQQSDHTGRDPVGFVLYVVYVLLLGASLLVLGRIVYIQTVWVPNEKIRTALVGKSSQARDLLPSRGNIYDCKGRLLAMSSPMYQFGIDCTVMKDAYALLGPEEQKQKEAEWDAKARALADALPAFFPEKTAAQYLEEFRSARRNGKKYLPLGKKKVDYYTRCSLLKLPLLSEAPTRGGRCEAREENRLYPYGKLARRTIGFVRSNRLQDVSNNHVGLEGKYNHELHGQEGVEWLRKTDAGHVHDYDKPFEMAVDGQHLHTTLDIDYQDLADGALRDLIADEQDLDGGCLVLMEVKTGAIRAMVNLSRTGSEAFDEVANIAIGRRQEPGSVFKTVTLMSVLSDGYVRRLDETIPTNHGWVSGTKIKQDTHIPDYERNHKTNRISIYDGFKMSSNYVFATLAVSHYRKQPRKYTDNLYAYKLGEKFDFDLEGLAAPEIPTPDSRYWTDTDLGNIGFGYTTMLTPLHLLTFYNAIADKGRMMKPYLVDCIEKNGVVVSRRGPQVLSASICSRAVADTLTRALKAVTEDGTAQYAFKGLDYCSVAGKTGTSFGTFNIDGKVVYADAAGRRKYQGTFAGFFPADDPQYSIICMIYSKPTTRSYQGGGIPARAVRRVIDGLYRTDPYFREKIGRKK